MAGVRFDLKEEDVIKLQQAVSKFGEGAEEVIGEYLENEANEIFSESIISLIPVSEKGKKHAKFSAPLTGDMEGVMSLYIHTKKPFHYLYFPDSGEGTSKGDAHEFMEKGVDNQYDTVVNGIIDGLLDKLNNL